MYRPFFGVMLSFVVSSSALADEYVVKYKDTESLTVLEDTGVSILDRHEDGRLLKVDIADKASLEKLKTNTAVEYVVPNFRLHAYGLQDQWALKKVKAAAAWERAGNKGSRSVVVAVIDTGVDSGHESLSDNVLPGYDFRDNDADPMDETSSANPGHGTHCSGIVGAVGSVDGGVSGMSAEVSILPIRFLGSDGSGDLMGAVKSIDYAIEQKARVISASWGATIDRESAKPLVEAVERADKAGIIFVSAAANDGSNNDTKEVYPANSGFPNTITVAASDSSDAKPYWSNYGKATVHLSSPGDKILSTLPGNKYGELSGTSMATPLVSGLVAFILAQDPTLTGAEVRALLQKSGAPVEIDTACNCRVDAEAAVAAVLGKEKWLVPMAATLKVGEEAQVSLKNSEGYVSYSSTDGGVVSVDNEGKLKALKAGEVKIKAVDQSGQTVESMAFTVAGTNPDPDPDPSEECPFSDPAICEFFCTIDPSYPWCD